MMTCPVCNSKTQVKDSVGEPWRVTKPARRVIRLLNRFEWRGGSFARIRRCLNPTCRRRYQTVELSTDDLTAIIEHAVATALAEGEE